MYGMSLSRYEKIGLDEKWFQARQGSQARVFSYIAAPGWSWGTRKSTLPYGHSTLYGSEGRIRDRAIQEVKGYPGKMDNTRFDNNNNNKYLSLHFSQ